jgi:hypothetical protein
VHLVRFGVSLFNWQFAEAAAAATETAAAAAPAPEVSKGPPASYEHLEDCDKSLQQHEASRYD